MHKETYRDSNYLTILQLQIYIRLLKGQFAHSGHKLITDRFQNYQA
jgi:hypothetical protein